MTLAAAAGIVVVVVVVEVEEVVDVVVVVEDDVEDDDDDDVEVDEVNKVLFKSTTVAEAIEAAADAGAPLALAIAGYEDDDDCNFWLAIRIAADNDEVDDVDNDDDDNVAELCWDLAALDEDSRDMGDHRNRFIFLNNFVVRFGRVKNDRGNDDVCCCCCCGCC